MYLQRVSTWSNKGSSHILACISCATDGLAAVPTRVSHILACISCATDGLAARRHWLSYGLTGIESPDYWFELLCRVLFDLVSSRVSLQPVHDDTLGNDSNAGSSRACINIPQSSRIPRRLLNIYNSEQVASLVLCTMFFMSSLESSTFAYL